MWTVVDSFFSALFPPFLRPRNLELAFDSLVSLLLSELVRWKTLRSELILDFRWIPFFGEASTSTNGRAIAVPSETDCLCRARVWYAPQTGSHLPKESTTLWECGVSMWCA